MNGNIVADEKNTYKHKKLTIRIECEYGGTKKLSDIISSLIIQKSFDNNRKIA